MKFFKKISAVTSSLLLAGMSIAVPIAAANYPGPFVSGSTADVAIVYGTGTGVSSLDLIQAGNIQTDLQSRMSGTSSGGTTSVDGEAYALYTSSRRIYMNDSINTVKASLTDSQLPTVLADGDFSGDVNADVTLRIALNGHPKLQFGNYPTSDDDPSVAISIGTTSANHLYNATVTFNKAVNLTDSDSVGETLDLFGKTYTVGSGTTTTDLYLYESSETLELSIGGSNPSSTTVTVDDAVYTVELISSSDDDATIKITDSAGASQTKTISEDASKKIQGVDVAVDLADETTNYGLKAQITVGADKIKLTDSAEVREGSDEDVIDGTNVIMSGDDWSKSTGFKIQAYATDTDEDAIVQGGSFTDPVFGSFKIDFSGLNSDDSRETIEVENAGDNKATIKMTAHTGDEKSVNFYHNDTSAAKLADSNGDVINVIERAEVNKSEYVVVGNEENGYLLELKTIFNSSATASDDYVEFKDVFSGKTYKSDTAATEGTVTLSVEGEDYTVTYSDDRDKAGDEYVRITYPDTNTAGYRVIYPTIQTSKGAKIAFYEPITLDLDDYDGSGSTTELSILYVPDGDGYSQIKFANTVDETWTITPYANGGSTAGTLVTLVTNSSDVESVAIGPFNYLFTASAALGDNYTTITIADPDDGTTSEILPGIILIEEQDSSTSNAYNGLFVEMEGIGLSTNGVGVNDVAFTWGKDDQWDDKQLDTDSDVYEDMDYYGVIATTDKGTSSQYTTSISYPDSQVYGEIYVAEESAEITSTSGTTTTTQLGDVLVKDSEVSSVSSKNLIIVGGSCINSAAAHVLGGSYCGASFTEQTTVGSGQFLLQGVAGAYTSGKIALLVAGYDAPDTVNAATYVRTQAFDTSKKYVGSSSTTAELITEETA